jgi:intracellular septation protein
MKFLFDLFPVVLFFLAYVLTDSLYIATAIIIPATVAQVVFAKYRFGRVDGMLWASLVLVLIMGSLTLFFHDKRFIMWKPTLLYWLFAVVLLGSKFLGKKNLIRAVMDKEVALPDSVWVQLNLAWAGFFTFMGALNLYVAFNFSETFWVKFKLFGGMGLMLVFVVLQALFLARYLHVKEDPRERQ